jgi:crossover junction endodeoxyribonuclease RusA
VSALALRVHVEGEPGHSVRVASPGKWLNANDRGAWQRHSPVVQQWRAAAGWAARVARVPHLTRVYVLAELRFGIRRRRDPGNWYPTVKACVDGIVDAGVLDNDSSDYLIGPDMRVGPVDAAPGSLTLHLWALS